MNTVADVTHAPSCKKGADQAIETRQRDQGSAPSVTADTVEISAGGASLTKLEDVINARAVRIAQARREIASGVYETPNKINATVDRLFAELNSVDLRA